MTRARWLGLLVLLTIPALAFAEEERIPVRDAKAIVADLKSNDLDTRVAAVEESRQCHDRSVTSQLVRMLKDKDG